MNNLKRFVALTLTMFMMISVLAMTVSAKTFTDVQALNDPDLSMAIDLLSEMGIARGVSADNFDPDSPVTRQQFALFIARIHTATPEYFVPSVSERDIPPFKDVVDNTYFTAINYCYENQIINGITEPTAESEGTFLPEEGIIFQDAVKMLVSGLGYAKTGLSYPVGYLAKAKEIGLLEGFNLSRLKAGDTVTRADMAGLLYNYFLNDYIEVVMVWNPVQNQYVANQVLSPVCEKFGITKIVGYVTAIEGAAIPLVVEDNLDPTSDKLIQFNATPIPMKTADPATPGNYNIVISYLTNAFERVTTTNYIPVYNFATGTTTSNTEIGWIEVQGTSTELRKTANFRTTKEALGLDQDYKDIAGSRELLGLKVIAFVNTKPNQNIKLPATVVVGQKTTNAKVSVNDVMTSERIDYSKFPVLTVESTGAKIELDRRRPTDLRSNSSIYVFDSTNGASAGIANTIETAPKLHPNAATNEDYMLGMIRTGGAYTVDYIDNGFNFDGTRNYAVIFTPFEAVYIRSHSDDIWTTTSGDGNNGDSISRLSARNKVIDSVTYASAGFGDAAGKAFFISRQGEYIIRHGAELTKLADNAVLSYLDNNTARFTRNVAWTSLADLQINYNSSKVFYRSLKNRTQTSNSFTTVKGLNGYDMKLQDTYHVFAVSSINPNYGYVGGSSDEFFVFQTGVGNKIDTGKHYGYILSTGNSAQLTNGVLAIPYTIYDISSKTQKVILDISNTSSPYAQGSHIVYYNQGVNSQRIAGAVDPFSFRTTTNPLTVTGTRAALVASVDTDTGLGTIDTVANTGRNDFGTGEVDTAFTAPAARINAIMAGLKMTSSASYNTSTVHTIWNNGLGVATWTGGVEVSNELLVAANAFYQEFALDDLQAAVTAITGAVAALEAAPTTGLTAWLTLARAGFEDAVVVLEDAVDDLNIAILDVIDEAALTAIGTADDRAAVSGLCEAYLAAIEDILAYVNADIIPAYRAYVDALTISDNSNTPARNSSLTGTAFLSANEAGWVASDRLFGINIDFAYDSLTKVVSVGNVNALNNGINATVNTNTPIFIFDAKSLTNVNMITRDQLDALIPQLGATAVRSALVVRDEFGQTTNNGAAKVLYIGLDGDDPVANQYLNSVTTATSYLKITEIGTVTASANGVNYRVVKAYDYVTGKTEDYVISANDPLYSNLAVGSIIYLSASTVTIETTPYRIAQLMSNYYVDESNQILTNTFLTNMIYTNSGNFAVLNYNAGVSVTTANGTVYNVNSTLPITFINLSVTRNAGSTAVTGFSINSDEAGLKVGATAATGSTFYSKAYDWEGFNSIRKSVLDSQLAKLTEFPRAGKVTGVAAGTWYVVPTMLSNSSIGGITLIYVNTVTAS